MIKNPKILEKIGKINSVNNFLVKNRTYQFEVLSDTEKFRHIGVYSIFLRHILYFEGKCNKKENQPHR